MKPLYTEINPNPFHGRSMIPRGGDFSFAKHFRRTRHIMGRPTQPMEFRKSINNLNSMKKYKLEHIWDQIIAQAKVDMILETSSPMAPIGGSYPTQKDAKVSFNQVTGSTSFASINKNKGLTTSNPQPPGRTPVYQNRDIMPKRLPSWR